MSQILEKNQGIYHPMKKYAWTNITDEEFVSYFNGARITIKPGQTVKLNQHLADKLTNELVDKIMITNAKADENKYYKKNPNTRPNDYRAASSLGVPAARKVWEDQIVKELPADPDSPEMQIMREEMKIEILTQSKANPSTEPVKVPVSAIGQFSQDSLKEFADFGSNPQCPQAQRKSH